MSAAEAAQASREIRSAIEFEIGEGNMEAFERWAFKCHPYMYQGDVSLRFENVHSTKHRLPKDNVEAIASIIHIWKHKNDWKMGGS